MRAVIVVAGEALVDLVVHGDHLVATPGGAPYNVARGCARLGAPTALMATLSTDGFGERLAAGLAESGVSDALLQRTDRPTTLAVAQLDAAGGATYRFYTEGTSAPLLTPGVLPSDVDVLVTGGLGLVLEPIATAIESVISGRDARRAGRRRPQLPAGGDRRPCHLRGPAGARPVAGRRREGER